MNRIAQGVWIGHIKPWDLLVHYELVGGRLRDRISGRVMVNTGSESIASPGDSPSPWNGFWFPTALKAPTGSVALSATLASVYTLAADLTVSSPLSATLAATARPASGFKVIQLSSEDFTAG